MSFSVKRVPCSATPTLVYTSTSRSGTVRLNLQGSTGFVSLSQADLAAGTIVGWPLASADETDTPIQVTPGDAVWVVAAGASVCYVLIEGT